MRTLNSPSFSPDARFLLGISQLSLSLAGEISDTVGTVHREVHSSTPLGLLPPQTNIARHVYALLKHSFLLPARMIGMAGHRIPPREVDAMTLSVQAAINGVFGDLLARQNNPLAFSMSIHGDRPVADQPLALFVHGLCLHEQRWDSPAHRAFVDTLRKDGFRVSWLRYNSGLPIADNARLLADLLETTGASRIVLIGHSMGGLISRSALHQASDAGHRWPGQTTHLAAIGSPHHGAEAERLGNYANRLLNLTRWSAPLTRLGNLRSAAIHDLRFGNLLHSDRERAADIVPPDELPDTEYPFILTTGRVLEHWHTGAMTRRATVLDAIEPEPFCHLSPADLVTAGIEPGDTIRVRTRRGAIALKARADRDVPSGTIFIPFCYAEAAVNFLTNPALDPDGKIPELKFCAARVERTNLEAAE